MTKINRRHLFKAAAAPLIISTIASVPKMSMAAQLNDISEPYGIPISAEFPFHKKTASVLGSDMAYVDEGTGPVVLFLHGNPTSSYLWRNVIPHVVKAGYRAIAPDLIGMGDSDKPTIAYTFDEHAAYLDAFIEATGLEDVTLAIHDWGSALGMRYARLNPHKVRSLVFMEAIIPPVFPAASYDVLGEVGDLFKAIRTEGVGEKMILTNNFFVEELLPKMGVARGLTAQEMAHYRAPYSTPESRLPTLQWPRELPIAGSPRATHDAIIANGEWLTSSNIPKLYFYASPGALNPAPVVQWIVANVPNLESRFLGHGTHFLQEDHPHLIGSGIADWLRRSDLS
jgi:haloalkane dehalogenase